MKFLFLSILVWRSVHTHGATIVQFKDNVQNLPQSFHDKLMPGEYELKPFWKEDRMTIQRLPGSTWEAVQRQKNLAVRLKDASQFLGLGVDPNIERILTDSETHSVHLKKVVPVKEPILPCRNSIYLGEYSARISQNLTKDKDCDGYWLFPEEDTPYEFSVSQGKILEVYEEGKVISSGSNSSGNEFQVAGRGQFIVVKGTPGPYTVSWKPTKYKDFKRVARFGELSNIFGFGSIEASKAYFTLTNKLSEKSSRVSHQGAYMMNVGALWSQNVKGSLTRVAVIDTGVDYEHPFLADVLEEGVNISEPGQAAKDDEGHGTHVSGIIHQVAPLAKIVPIKVLDKNGSGTIKDIVKGVEWAIAQNVDVINLSIGGEVDDPSFFQVLERAAEQGILVAMAAGNDSRFTPTFPANYVTRAQDLGFAVGALNLGRELTIFSDRSGNDPDMKYVAAFGEMVNSSIPGGGYKKFSGTSMATPQVSGLFALFKSLPEKLPSKDILKALKNSVLLTSVED